MCASVPRADRRRTPRPRWRPGAARVGNAPAPRSPCPERRRRARAPRAAPWRPPPPSPPCWPCCALASPRPSRLRHAPLRYHLRASPPAAGGRRPRRVPHTFCSSCVRLARRVSYAGAPSVVRRVAECRTAGRRRTQNDPKRPKTTPKPPQNHKPKPPQNHKPKPPQNHKPKPQTKPNQRSSCTDSNRGWRMPSFSPQRFFNPATEEFKVLSDDHYTTRALSTIPPPQMCPLYAQFLRLPISPRRYKLLIRATLGPHQATQARRADLSLKRRTNRIRFLVQDESSAPPPHARAHKPRAAHSRVARTRARDRSLAIARSLARSLARSRTPRQHAGRAGRRRGV